MQVPLSLPASAFAPAQRRYQRDSASLSCENRAHRCTPSVLKLGHQAGVCSLFLYILDHRFGCVFFLYRPSSQYSDEQIADALRTYRGNLSAVARILGLRRQSSRSEWIVPLTWWRWRMDELETLLDKAEENIYEGLSHSAVAVGPWWPYTSR